MWEKDLYFSHLLFSIIIIIILLFLIAMTVWEKQSTVQKIGAAHIQTFEHIMLAG